MPTYRIKLLEEANQSLQAMQSFYYLNVSRGFPERCSEVLQFPVDVDLLGMLISGRSMTTKRRAAIFSKLSSIAKLHELVQKYQTPERPHKKLKLEHTPEDTVISANSDSCNENELKTDESGSDVENDSNSDSRESSNPSQQENSPKKVTV